MSKSADAMEQEVEATRERLDRTLDSLQSHLNVSGLARDLAGLRHSGATMNESAERLIASARANPIPALLICAGVGFLVYDAVSKSVERRRLAVMRASPHPRGRDADLAENHPDRLHDRLDDALEESFPGSDPISVKITK